MNLATLPGLLRVLHALAGIGVIVGLFGRWMVLAAAERASTPAHMRVLTRAAAPFETLVIVGSLLFAWTMFNPAVSEAAGISLTVPLLAIVVALQAKRCLTDLPDSPAIPLHRPLEQRLAA